ncbi:hypothetical protein [Streptomyces arenae]|uniref:hypothetical protein n=1 Tax=Streptomyces arenae TaxID=29301 RepID=UPI00265A65DF|nr:hypothetical protein [Streptomyces arenae]MCG7204667.1 hypothetical protein [Streptomyces arenae]
MRGTGRRIRATGLAAVALAAALTACTAGGGGGGGDGHGTTAARPKACRGGTFTWSGVKQSDRLTGVSASQRLGKGGGALENPLRRVYTPHPSVRTEGPALSPAEVLFSLGKRIGEIDSTAATLADDDSGTTYVFTDVHAKAPALDDGFTRIDGPGDIVAYAGVREVTGTFRYSCRDGASSTGQARNWRVDLAGLVNCGETVGAGIARQAARLSCEDGSAARKGA